MLGLFLPLPFVPNQPHLAVGAGDGFVYIRHLRDGGLVTSLRASRSNTAFFSYPRVADLEFSADGQTLVTAADDAVRVWNMTDYSFTTLSPRPRGDVGASEVAISSNGQFVVMSHYDERTYLWDLTQTSQHQEFTQRVSWRKNLILVPNQEFC
ncbi:MAG: hypothetical protein IPL28_08120 [Chloroflexi bacterium]|nr:hypothetical protein [Chloroflexota bacterium]